MRKMPMKVPIITIALALVVACGSSSQSNPTPSPPKTPSSSSSQKLAFGSVNVRAECKHLYGSDVDAVGLNGHGSTGWYCKINGELVEFTHANMQDACDHQHPGKQIVNLAPKGEASANNNSKWLCVPGGNTSTTTSTSGPAGGGQSCDGLSPQGRCGTNGHLKNKYVLTVSRRTLRLPNGQVFGRLLLRHSTICQTAWGEVVFRATHKPTGFAVTIITVRPRDHSQIPYTTKDYVSPSFTFMLENNGRDNGCVFALAHVTAGGRDGPTVRTNCSAS
jgi:hypothetical protein